MELNLKYIFLFVVSFTICQRLYELYLSNSNIKKLKSKGAIVVKETNYIFMVVLHSSWLAVILYYALFIDLSFSPLHFSFFFAIFCLGQAMRILAIKTLGERWTTKIVILPEAPAIRKGPFKFIRHPNYLGVVLELFSLPMMGGLLLVSLFFSLANFIILFFRIKLEESQLKKHNDYQTIFNSP